MCDANVIPWYVHNMINNNSVMRHQQHRQSPMPESVHFQSKSVCVLCSLQSGTSQKPERQANTIITVRCICYIVIHIRRHRCRGGKHEICSPSPCGNMSISMPGHSVRCSLSVSNTRASRRIHKHTKDRICHMPSIATDIQTPVGNIHGLSRSRSDEIK